MYLGQTLRGTKGFQRKTIPLLLLPLSPSLPSKRQTQPPLFTCPPRAGPYVQKQTQLGVYGAVRPNGRQPDISRSPFTRVPWGCPTHAETDVSPLVPLSFFPLETEFSSPGPSLIEEDSDPTRTPKGEGQISPGG